MESGRFTDDDSGELSETAAVGVLVVITLFMTLSAGVYVLAVDTGEQDPVANFSYDYDGDGDTLLVRYVEGEGPAAADVVLEGEERSASWAQLSGKAANDSLAPDDAIQLSSNGDWGRPITDATEIRIYLGSGVNRTQVSQWNTSL